MCVVGNEPSHELTEGICVVQCKQEPVAQEGQLCGGSCWGQEPVIPGGARAPEAPTSGVGPRWSRPTQPLVEAAASPPMAPSFWSQANQFGQAARGERERALKHSLREEKRGHRNPTAASSRGESRESPWLGVLQSGLCSSRPWLRTERQSITVWTRQAEADQHQRIHSIPWLFV